MEIEQKVKLIELLIQWRRSGTLRVKSVEPVESLILELSESLK